MRIDVALLLSLLVAAPYTSRAGCDQPGPTAAIDVLQQKGVLIIELIANGGHRGNCITMRISNVSHDFITTTLEPGRTLVSIQPDQQNLLVTQSIVIAVLPEQTVEKQVVAYCYQSLNAGPGEGSLYLLGPMAATPLLDIANYLDQHTELDESTQQQAIWVVSDCHPLSSVHVTDAHGEALSAYIAQLLSIERPWYTTDHVRTADQLFTKQVARIYGQMKFEITDYTGVSIIIYDPNGRIIKRLLQDTRYGPGNYTHPIDLWVHHWPTGTYNVQLETGDQQSLGSYAFEL